MAGRWFKPGSEERPTVGDWVVLVEDRSAVESLVKRRNLLRRKQADGLAAQPIAANVDALFIVTACNNEFNPSRLERYLLVAEDANVQPVIVLTKMDTTDTPETFVDAAVAIANGAPVHAVDALNGAGIEALKPWCGPGQTLVLLGSSGVGKSTLLNSLAGTERQKTGAARNTDDKGRHTTSHRSLHALPDGTLIIDSPGIRELGLTEDQSDPAAAFVDIEDLALTCRFRDCRHENEPDCAVRTGITSGLIDPRRLANWRRIHGEKAAARLTALTTKPRDTPKRKGKLARRPTK